MNFINSEDLVARPLQVKLSPVAIIRDNDTTLCTSLSDQMRGIGLSNVIVCADPNPDTFAQVIHDNAQAAGVLILGLRDAVLGPVDIADLRQSLPDWVIIVIDITGQAQSSADALAAGADDVLRSPFTAPEFEARVALRMRKAGMAENSTVLKSPLIARAQLTPVESQIMRILLAHKGKIVTRNQLSQLLDRADWLYGDRKFDVHITHIRKKLRAAYGDRFLVQTIRAKGYMVEILEDTHQP